MSVIHFNASDALQTTIVPKDIYTCEITSITGPTKSSTGKSNNYTVEFQITDGKYKGKTHTIVINTESTGASVLGNRQFFPLNAFLAIDAAITGREIKPEDYALETDGLLHKPLDISWAVVPIADGSLINTIGTFHPSGYAKDKAKEEIPF